METHILTSPAFGFTRLDNYVNSRLLVGQLDTPLVPRIGSLLSLQVQVQVQVQLELELELELET
jgi:hypothetical protein